MSAFKANDWVEETTTTTGTGDLTLAGATTGSHALSTLCADGDLFGYSITDGTGNTESGIGTYHSSGNTFSRTTVKTSTNSGSAVSWGAGTKTVRCTLLASAVEFNLAGRLVPNAFDDVSKSGDYTILATDKGKSFICTATLVLTLPSATDRFWFEAYNASTSGYVTVGSLVRLLPGEYVRAASDGSSFYVLDSRLLYPIGSVDRPPVTANAADDEWYEVALDTGGTRISSATPWAWNNQGSTTGTFGSGRALLSGTSTGQSAIEQAVPVGNYRFRAKLSERIDVVQSSTYIAISVRNSANGKLVTCGPGFASSFGIPALRWTNMTTFSSTPKGGSGANDPFLWKGYVEFEYDGTNLIWRGSATGEEGSFSKVYTETAATFLGAAPTHVGLFLCVQTGSTVTGISGWWRRMA